MNLQSGKTKEATKPRATGIMSAIALALSVSAISPAMAQDVLVVDNNKVGIGVSSPDELMHVQGNATGYPVLFLMENLGSSFGGFRFKTTEGSIDFNKAGGNTFRLNIVDGDGWELQLEPNGNLTVRGQIITAGSCSGGCDRVFKPDYKLPTIEEHAKSMWRDGHLPAVGPTEEGQSFNLTDKTERMLNELEKAHIYIAQLNDELHQKKASITDLEARLARLEAALEVRN